MVINNIATQIYTSTLGFLSPINTSLLAENCTENLDTANLKLFKKGDQFIPMQQNDGLDAIVKLIFNTPYRFQQNETEQATAFVEIPKLCLKRVELLIKELDIPCQISYVTVKDIAENKDDKFDPRIVEVFSKNSKLLEYFNRFIVNKEEIKIHATYLYCHCALFVLNSWLASIHMFLFKKHGEKWVTFRMNLGEFPSEDDLKSARGLFVPGSAANAYDSEKYPWIPPMLKRLTEILTTHTHLNYLGICFGGQIASMALGGEIAKMDCGHIYGGETLKPTKEFYELSYVKDLGLDSNAEMCVAEAHGDFIKTIPKDAVCYAVSKQNYVEIFGIGERVLAWQGHPDYSELMQARGRYVISKSTENYDEFVTKFLAQAYPTKSTQKINLTISYNFLKKINS